ncbi:alpha-L-rhamnosidase-related protein [Thermomonospora echinospora]|uniref:alpha-L-rhamnosidase-related protein n=1 Tax=Thermomonospora echinospora TaxID=1992 RepID=UPI000CDE976C|nr:alpha-L-rhamnosidase C-terminal domain-containing protein [Thermomonospora echinospora]
MTAALAVTALTLPVFLGGVPAAQSAPVEKAPWQSYNLSPASRTVKPVAVFRTNGTVTDPDAVLKGDRTRLSGAGSYLTLDFGKNVTGLVTLKFAGSDGPQRVGLAFSESSEYVGIQTDASTGGPRSRDGAIYADVDGRTTYTMPAKYLRGGFRYLTVFLESAGSVDLEGVSAHFTAAPKMDDLRDYANYFYSSDELLNRIWYAGAYTIQLNTIDPKTGRVWEAPPAAWDNSGDVGVGDTILVDGAKRDRTVWPGDLGIEVPAAYAAFNDTESARNALTTIYRHQRDTGELPYAGPMLNKYGSDTYHLWTLAATWDYYLYTADRAWLAQVWDDYIEAVDYTQAKVNDRGLLSITGTSDSVRILAKGENLIANVLLWRVLTTGSKLAATQGDSGRAADYASRADALRTAIDTHLWDEQAGAYKFYPDSTIHAQDGNSLAVWYGLADQDKARRISAKLKGNWSPIGTTAPENKGNPGVFSGSMEVNAHFAAGGQEADQAGVDIIRRQWGYMLDHPQGTKSTFWESFRNLEDSCVFCSSYVSLAHAWATGPTPALTFDVLGLKPTAPAGRTYDFVPHPADLTFAQGRITTPQGRIDASWKLDRAEGAYRATLTAPRGTTGRVGVPILGTRIKVFVDGRLAWNGHKGKAYGAHSDGEYVYLDGLPAGSHTVTADRLGAS